MSALKNISILWAFIFTLLMFVLLYVTLLLILDPNPSGSLASFIN